MKAPVVLYSGAEPLRRALKRGSLAATMREHVRSGARALNGRASVPPGLVEVPPMVALKALPAPLIVPPVFTDRLMCAPLVV